MTDPHTKEGREELRRIASRVPDGPRVRIQRSVLVDLPEARCGRKSCYVTHLESSEPFSLEHAEMARAFDRPTVEALLDLAEEQADRIAFLEAPPKGFPDCTTAITRAMSQKDGEILVRIMHRNEMRIAALEAERDAAYRRGLEDAAGVATRLILDLFEFVGPEDSVRREHVQHLAYRVGKEIRALADNSGREG